MIRSDSQQHKGKENKKMHQRTGTATARCADQRWLEQPDREEVAKTRWPTGGGFRVDNEQHRKQHEAEQPQQRPQAIATSSHNRSH